MEREELVKIIGKIVGDKFDVEIRTSKGHEKDVLLKRNGVTFYQVFNDKRRNGVHVFSRSKFLDSVEFWKKYPLNFKPTYDFKYYVSIPYFDIPSVFEDIKNTQTICIDDEEFNDKYSDYITILPEHV